MRLFKRHKEDFRSEDPIKARFDQIMDLVWDLDKKDYNRLVKAMDNAYRAYSMVRGIEEPGETTGSEVASQGEVGFIVTSEESK